MSPATSATTNNINNNWLSFSLSPMEMLATSLHHHQSPQIIPSTISNTSYQHYFLDTLYSNGNSYLKRYMMDLGDQNVDMGMYTDYMVDQHIDNHNQNNNSSLTSSTVPKLEDFFGGDHHNTTSYNSQDESSSQLTHRYESHNHQNSAANYFTDLKAMATAVSSVRFQAAFSANSGSEVVDSAATQQIGCGGGEFVGQCIESTQTELVPSYPRNNNNGGSLSLAVVPQSVEKSDNSSAKKVSDTFGQRTSIYRGVTRHRWTGRYEAHLWDNSCRREGQVRKGRQVYLGGYDKEEKAARSYDLAALKYWGPAATTNFPISNYSKEIEDMKVATKQEFIASLRRKSSGFSRGASIYRGVTKHHQQGRWQARIGRVAGNKDLYLGTFATEQEAAEAYDIAAIKFRGVNAVTNFEMNRYDVEAILKTNLPVGGAAKRLKLATEAADQKPVLSLDQQSQSVSSSGNSGTINFAAIQSGPPISCAVPYDSATASFYHNLFHHLNSNGGAQTVIAESYGSGASPMTAQMMSLMPQTSTESYIWPHQSY